MVECGEHGIFEDETGRDCPICGATMASDDQTVIYTDGAGWNGRVSRWCVAQHGKDPRVIVRLEKFTSNEMEYAALISALQEAPAGAMIRTDSRLVVGQVARGWKIQAKNLQGMADAAKQLVRQKQIILVWIPRECNLAGIHLENTAGVR